MAGPRGKILLFYNKRCEVEIIHDLLSSAQEEIKKTHLMYRTNMTYNQFIKYLDALKEKDLIEEIKSGQNGNNYYLTEKGKKLLDCLNKVLKYLK